jgi:D-alanyl-D-alanine carboxypeptidase/D-alanyl-D-alanine-endopeptidase (penicillin-binding protein 4)
MLGSPRTHLATTALFAAFLLVGMGGSLQERLEPKVQPYLQHGCVVVADDQGILYSGGDTEPLIPASTLKLATALAALHYLGEDWRPKTEFYLSPDNDLIVRGYGDPFLISEEWKTIAENLSQVTDLPRSLRKLQLDPSAFFPDIQIPGLKHLNNPSYALNGALVANFNTVHVNVKPDGTVTSAETQTPLTPVCRRRTTGLPPGNHRVNLSGDPEAALSYAGELLQAFLEHKGFVFQERIQRGKSARDDRLVYTHRNTRSLREILGAMMLYSNNFTANQLLLVIGMKQEGEPATLDKGLTLLRAYLTGRLGIPPARFHVVEGSGISRENRLHPEALIALTRAFFPYRSLLTVQDGVQAKTGTLRGVYTMAGVLDTERPLFFAIMLNQKKNNRNRILSVLRNEVP